MSNVSGNVSGNVPNSVSNNLPDYAELHCISNFSFLRGASHPGELVNRAVELGYQALAITDECSLAGVVRAHVAAKAVAKVATKKHRFHLIIGSEFQLEEGLRLVLLATDRTSYGHLSHLITLARRNAGKGEYKLTRELVETHTPAGCLALFLPSPQAAQDIAQYQNQAKWLSNLFPNKIGRASCRERV